MALRLSRYKPQYLPVSRNDPFSRTSDPPLFLPRQMLR